MKVFMCGIAGYTGAQNAIDILFDSLAGLEYRGYDSAGISIFSDKELITFKTKGRLKNLINLVSARGKPISNCGIGHTRWATHGEPSDINAHPHFTKKLSLVHNGIIENYIQIKENLISKGYTFTSQTDTECAAKLIDSLYHGYPIEAIKKAQKIIKGSYAFGILFADHPNKLYAARRDSPLIAAKSDNGNFIASDVPAILKYTRDYYLIDDNEIVELDNKKIQVYSAEGNPIDKSLSTASWTINQAQKAGYAHYMLKEIHEQPKMLFKTVHPRISDGLPSFIHDEIPDSLWNNFKFIDIVACGTAMHAGMLGKSLIERLARIPVKAKIASEFRYENPILSKQHLVIVISQSGETADTLAALRLAKEKGAITLAIINVAGSSIEREADFVIHTYAGPEIAVASTKAYSTQLAIMYLIAFKITLSRGVISSEHVKTLTDNLLNAIKSTNETLKLNDDIKKYVVIFKYLKNLFFLGRGLDCMLALEGSLKLKEISYIHCEAYAAGELKHGTISLITDHVPVIALATQESLLPKMISNIKEVHSRGADVLLFCKKGFNIDKEIYTHKIELPALDDLFMPLVGIIPLQMLAYHTAVLRECDVDKPRNLAKSVTVE